MIELEELDRETIESLVDRYILNERNRQIMKRRLFDGIYFEQLAEEFDLSSRHKQQKLLFKKISSHEFSHS